MPDPTRADSLDLLQNSLALENYYAGKGYNLLKETPITAKDAPGVYKTLDDKLRSFTDKYSEDKLTGTMGSRGTTGYAKIDPRFYRENTNGETFKQRDIAHGTVDFDAPFSLYNRNISPQYLTQLEREINARDYDVANYFSYDPLAVSPADTLSDTQLKERFSKFGGSGISESKLKSLGLSPAERPSKSKSSLAREVERRKVEEQQRTARDEGYTGPIRGREGKNPEWEAYLKSKALKSSTVQPLPNELESSGDGFKQPVVQPQGREDQYYMTKHPSRDADPMDYHFKEWNPDINDYIDKRITKEDYLKATRKPKVQSRNVIANFAYGGSPQEEQTPGWDQLRGTAAQANPIIGAFHQVGQMGEQYGENIAQGDDSGITYQGKAGNFLSYASDPFGKHMEQAKQGDRRGIASTALTMGMSDNFFGKFGYAYGGNVYDQGGPVYEAEGGEVIDGGNPNTLNGGRISPNSSTSGKIIGNSHSNGGVKMTGGEKIYSDRLTVDASFLKDLDI